MAYTMKLTRKEYAALKKDSVMLRIFKSRWTYQGSGIWRKKKRRC